ncbi:MAG: bifunctional folylpolyglutamate synthase/dihydrofolate synthase [Anaerolineae bacterium]|nr:bifunctional folylpolyglutamate synthase/dihydrofolate synthase [Anaerolineae bacterium]
MTPETSHSEFRSALDYLYSFIDYSRIKQSEAANGEFNLEQMKKFLAMLGNPEQHGKYIHVAGTKGKGSTASMVASILRAAGYHVGLFTSPHMQHFTERIQIDGVPISRDDFVVIMNFFRPLLEQLGRITWFEITAAIAFYHFANQDVDFVVTEVGLGGRLDATNVIDPLVSVITSISYDHMKILGNTIAAIASEKGGIIKPNRPVVVAHQYFPDALSSLKGIAANLDAPVYLTDDLVRIQPEQSHTEGQVFQATWHTPDGMHSGLFSLPLLGNFQLENAASAILCIAVLNTMGYSIRDETIRAGLSHVFWPGRMEIVSRQPLVIIDSAHNPYSIQQLLESLDQLANGREIVLLFGASSDKDVVGMLKLLLPRCETVFFSHSVHPRSYDPTELNKLANSLGYNGTAISPVEKAVSACLERCGEDSLLLATGSIFLAAAVRNVWHHYYQPLPGFFDEE